MDLKPGDRRSGCHGAMEPIAIATRYDGEWSVVHRCKACGRMTANRIAGDDCPLVLVSLAVRPLARPPFPLDSLGQLQMANGIKGGTVDGAQLRTITTTNNKEL